MCGRFCLRKEPMRRREFITLLGGAAVTRKGGTHG
jgi:hypothetical protein